MNTIIPSDRRTVIAVQASYLSTALDAVRKAAALEPDEYRRANLDAQAHDLWAALLVRNNDWSAMRAESPEAPAETPAAALLTTGLEG